MVTQQFQRNVFFFLSVCSSPSLQHKYALGLSNCNTSFAIFGQMVRRLKWIATGSHVSVTTGQFRNTHQQSNFANSDPPCQRHVRSLTKIPKLDIYSDTKSQPANFGYKKSLTITAVLPKLFECAVL